MMRYVILIAMLLCLPVRGEAWQVVGGGGDQPCDDGILANGCFDDDDLSGWTPYTTSGFSAANGTATVSNNGYTYRYVTASLDSGQSITTSEEYSYAITFIAMSAGSMCRFSVGGVSVVSSATAPGTFSGTFTATSDALPTVKVNTSDTTDFCTFDNVKISLP